MVKERALPNSAVFVAIDPISAKGTALFNELMQVSNVRFIFVAEGLDSHANYLMARKRGLVRQLLSADFGVLRRLADSIAKKSKANRSLIHQISDLAEVQGDGYYPERHYSVSSMSALSGARVAQLDLLKVSKDRFAADAKTLRLFSEVDFGVLLSFNLILSGPILETNWGVWSFHPADTFRYRGRPSCFWEFIDDAPFGVTLQRLAEQVDGGPVLAQRHLNLPKGKGRTLEQVRPTLEMFQLGMIPEALATVQKSGGTDLPSPDVTTSRYHHQKDADRFLPSLRYLFKVVRNLMRR